VNDFVSASSYFNRTIKINKNNSKLEFSIQKNAAPVLRKSIRERKPKKFEDYITYKVKQTNSKNPMSFQEAYQSDNKVH